MTEPPSQSQRKSILSQLPHPQFSAIDNPIEQSCDVIVVGVPSEGPLSATAAALDESLGGAISGLRDQDLAPQETNDSMLIPGPAVSNADGSGAKLVLLMGMGEVEDRTRQTVFRVASTALRDLNGKERASVIVALGEDIDSQQHDALVAGVLYAHEGQALYRSKPTIHVPDTIAFSGVDQAAIDRGQAIGDSTNLAKRLINEPASEIYPESFAQVIETMCGEVGLSCEVWDDERLAHENCNAILAVGAGSDRPPRLVILRYDGGQPGEQPIALVGKGVTFDSGGLSLKPSDGMIDMKCDMGGAATVVATMHAMAKLGVKKNVIGLCGLAENMVSGSSYKLGDVIKTRSGKTIEILNTDAEGRVVLADTLNVAIEHQPVKMLDLATLTGACMVALGTEVAGAMTNDQLICDEVLEAAKSEGEPLWQLPMFSLFNDKVKSKVADIKNIGEGRWGGAITAAKFLENFVGDTPWVHLDIAGPAFADSPKPYRDAGGTGTMVRTLIRWIEAS